VESFVNFLFGNPGETLESIWRTIEYAKELRPPDCAFGIVRPFPGSELYDIGLREGLRLEGNWKEYEMYPDRPMGPPPVRANLLQKDLFNLMKEAQAIFR